MDMENTTNDEKDEKEKQKEEFIQERTHEISTLFKKAQRKTDLDFILKRFNIKCIKNKKNSSPMILKMAIKRKIIKMAIEEPEDIFDYDVFCQNQTNP